jgi:hypothetical protein
MKSKAEVKQRIKAIRLFPLWAFVARYRVTFTFNVAHLDDQLQVRQTR